jgi:hypothetical protein
MHIRAIFGYDFVSYYKEIATFLIRSRGSSQIPYMFKASSGVSVIFSVLPGRLYYSSLRLLVVTFL